MYQQLAPVIEQKQFEKEVRASMARLEVSLGELLARTAAPGLTSDQKAAISNSIMCFQLLTDWAEPDPS